MDATRRISQTKSTKGWLNFPYSRFGCLRIRRRIQTHADRDSAKELSKQPGKQVASVFVLILNAFIFPVKSDILLLGSVRLDVRRVSGQIKKNQVYWREGDDEKGMCVFNPKGITVIDDAARDKPPYISFEFKFREDPEITKMNRRIAEEKADTKIDMRVTRNASAKSRTLALPATGNAQSTSFHLKDYY